MEKDTWKTIENFRYSFDSDGKMRTGWHYEDGEVYYLGDPDEGFARTGWQFLEYSERAGRRREKFPQASGGGCERTMVLFPEKREGETIAGGIL